MVMDGWMDVSKVFRDTAEISNIVQQKVDSMEVRVCFLCTNPALEVNKMAENSCKRFQYPIEHKF